MEEKAQKRFEHILSLAAGDETYQQLLRQCAALDRPLAEVLAGLPGETQMLFREYIRVLGASALRLVEKAKRTHGRRSALLHLFWPGGRVVATKSTTSDAILSL